MQTISKKEIGLTEKVIAFAKTVENDYTYKIAAAIIYKNKIIKLSHNEIKSHTFQKQYAKNEHAIYFHAETSVIHKARKILGDEKLKKATLIVARVSQIRSKAQQKLMGHNIAEAKPCEGCESCIKDFGIKKVIYTTQQGTMETLH